MSLVGEMDTVIMARELVMSANRTVNKALPMSLQAKFLQQTIKFHRCQCEATQAEIPNLLSAIVKHDEANKGDTAESEKLKAALEKANASFERHRSDGLAATNDMFTLMQSYGKLITAEWGALNHKLDELIHAIRTELGLESSLERLYQSTAEMEAEGVMNGPPPDISAAMPSAFWEAMTTGRASVDVVRSTT
jgi:hypothetical protein